MTPRSSESGVPQKYPILSVEINPSSTDEVTRQRVLQRLKIFRCGDIGLRSVPSKIFKDLFVSEHQRLGTTIGAMDGESAYSEYSGRGFARDSLPPDRV
jgi:hypothetical protein